jgi:ABC-type sugar transport system ATPase subunit
VARRLVDRPPDVLVGLRAEGLVEASPASSPLTFAARVEITEELGSEILAYLRVDGLDVDEHLGERPVGLGGTVIARLGARSSIQPDARIDVSIDAGELHLFDASTGRSLLRRDAPVASAHP